ncbi:MAG: anthranilate phosphoribosyltransferase [Myxococcota bacterium]
MTRAWCGAPATATVRGMTGVDDRGTDWETMRGILARVAVGPRGSRDLDRAEAGRAMRLCLDRGASDIQIAVFLIAMRLKRETEAENLGFLDALVGASHVVVADTPAVVSLADPYDGGIRAPHAAPLIAATLAACGLPTVVHGAWTTAPKFGLTARQVLEARGLKLAIGGGRASVESAAERLAERGVAYVDVEDFCPPLHALADIRREIAKRVCLATLEKLVTPLRGRESTHLVAGYVHTGYETLIATIAADLGLASALVLEASEGHVDPWVHRDTSSLLWRAGGQPEILPLQPKSYGLLISERPVWPELDAAAVAEIWEEALHRKRRTPVGQALRLVAGAILFQTGRASTVMRGVGMAHQALTSGGAREKLTAFGA